MTDKILQKLIGLMMGTDKEPMTDMEVILFGMGPMQPVGSQSLPYGTVLRLTDWNGTFYVAYGGRILACAADQTGFVRGVIKNGLRYDIPFTLVLQWNDTFNNTIAFQDFFAMYRVF